jgi:hypothetical protein
MNKTMKLIVFAAVATVAACHPLPATELQPLIPGIPGISQCF